MKLRYTASDASGKTAEEVRVFSGTKVITSGKTGLAPSAVGKVYTIGWTTPAHLAGQTFKFCIRSRDPSGTVSGWSCAQVKLT